MRGIVQEEGRRKRGEKRERIEWDGDDLRQRGVY